jgi:endonuclease/exonuclease/phosphatase family metal-dependent hydrolase
MKKIIKIIAIVVAAVFLAIVLIFGGYVGYVALSYYRIEDGLAIGVEGNAESKVKLNEEYSLMSYNVGFGAYSPDYTFFLDEGEMKDGTKTVGVHGKGISYDDVKKNVDGQESVIKAQATDFVFVQEVDKEADRSYKINMYEQFTNALPTYSSVYASNFHTAYLMYPFNDPIGATTDAGILTLSKYKIESSVRRSLPLSDSFISNLFDLDRCFSVSYLPINGSDKKLTLINIHMSAYDEGGTVRAKQLEMLNNFLADESKAGNYVIVGGDFNHCLIADQFASDEEALNYFPSEQVTPDWVKNSVLHTRELVEGYKIVASTNASTCRGADMVYEEGVTYSTVIDGFIVSDNIEVIEEGTIQTNYAYSDHNPVKIKFMLKV